MFLKKKGPIDVPGGLILLPMFAAHPYNHFCTEYPPGLFELWFGLFYIILHLEKLVLKYHNQNFYNNELVAIESQNKQAYINMIKQDLLYIEKSPSSWIT